MKNLQLIPNQNNLSTPLFKTETEYQQFCESFRKQMQPALDKLREARILSDEDSRHHIAYHNIAYIESSY